MSERTANVIQFEQKWVKTGVFGGCLLLVLRSLCNIPLSALH